MSPRPSLPQPSPGISRVDQKSTRTHGYVGRLGYRQTDTGWRPAHKAFFGDASNGGPAGALKAAEAWLRQTRRKLAAQERAGTAVAGKPARGRTVAKKAAKPATRPAARKATKPAAKKAGAKGAGARRGAVRVASRRKKAAAGAR